MRHRRSRRSVVAAGALVGLFIAAAGSPVGAEPPPINDPDLSRLLIDPGTEVGTSSRAPVGGRVDVVLRLTGPSVAQAAGPNATKGQARLDAKGQKARAAKIDTEQDAVSGTVRRLGGKELGRVSRALNAVVVRVDSDQIAALAATPGVASITPLRRYEMDLSETVPYIGARSGEFAQPGGSDGAGVTVAVLDSGVDYTHADLGGGGTVADYEAAYGTGTGDPRNTTRDGLFPTAKVVEGYDFVGEGWPNTPEAPDADPIDYEGHGTHVADIIAGADGDAPGASILAVKVCSAVSSSCSGLALLQGMDYALDPNGDGSINDAVDVINMSLGSSFGQQEDDLSFASQNAVDAGVTVVASAGNSADRPYIVGSPSSTPGVISVAQTQVPSAVAFPLVLNGASGQRIVNNTATVEWAPVGDGFTGDVAYVGRACPGDALLTSPSGKVALVDRGACAVSLKTDVAADAGAVGVLVVNNVAGDPPTFSFGGGDTMVPTMIISLTDGNYIKAELGRGAVTASVSAAVSVPLAGSMVASSSRGPSMSFDAIKPDIGAPGASVSAIAGSGDGTQAFGGTSGAAPMVSGAAALLLSADGGAMEPLAVKARLMGTGDTDIQINPATQPGVLAPITRIGGGEVQVDDAFSATTLAHDSTPGSVPAPSLSFGYHTVAGPTTLERQLTISNTSNVSRTYTLTPTFRYSDDEASGAVTPSIVGGNSVVVGAGGTATVTVRLAIDPADLSDWPFNRTVRTGNGAALNGPEYDGYLLVGDQSETIHVPWHVLPHKAAAVEINKPNVNLSSKASRTVRVSNTGAFAGDWDAFALTAQSPQIPVDQQPGAGANLAAIDLRAVGVRAFPDDDAIQFGVNLWDERSHPSYPAGVEVDIDVDRDGDFDYALYQQELNGFAATGDSAVWVANLATNVTSAYYYLDADLNSSNRILTAPLSALGLTAGTQFDFQVLAYDNYFSGAVTDETGPMTYTTGTPRYVFGGGLSSGSVRVGARGNVQVSAVAGGNSASPSQTGILLLHRDNPQGREASLITVRP